MKNKMLITILEIIKHRTRVIIVCLIVLWQWRLNTFMIMAALSCTPDCRSIEQLLTTYTVSKVLKRNDKK